MFDYHLQGPWSNPSTALKRKKKEKNPGNCSQGTWEIETGESGVQDHP